MSLIEIVYLILVTATAWEEQVKQESNLRNPVGGTFYRINSWVYSTGTWYGGNGGGGGGRVHGSEWKAFQRQWLNVPCGP